MYILYVCVYMYVAQYTRPKRFCPFPPFATHTHKTLYITPRPYSAVKNYASFHFLFSSFENRLIMSAKPVIRGPPFI